MWSNVDLTAGKTPILYDGEVQRIACRLVGIYNDDRKSLDHQQGWIYLTNRRICYVDDDHPEENSTGVYLKQLGDFKYSPRFLRQSPKVTLHIKPTPGKKKPTKSWICNICSFSNPLSIKYVPGESELPRCDNCGVQCWESPEFVELHANQSSATDSDENRCSRCTFVNHPYMRECEICGFVLKEHKSRISLGSTIRISFRAGGAKEFYELLKEELSGSAVADKTTAADKGSPTPDQSFSNSLNVGINRLEIRSEVPPTDDLETAFKDVHEIESGAKNVMRILGARKRIMPDYIPTYTIEGNLVFRDFAHDEKTYLVQLARQISEFLESNGILKKEGGLMTLYDVFSAYNRARGVEPIPATDITAALRLGPELGMPIRMRTLRSGTVIIESNLWTSSQERLASWIKRSHETTGVTMLDVGEQFGWSITVAIEELEQSEEMGLLCRDEAPAGVRFYLNLFK